MTDDSTYCLFVAACFACIRFVSIGSHVESKHSTSGLGNTLIFFPGAYYFALLSGRDILIAEQSIVGAMCRIVSCGYPFMNDIPALRMPSGKQVKPPESVKTMDFVAYMAGTKSIDSIVVRASGYMYSGAWWMRNNHTSQAAAACIQQITGCAPYDTPCTDRYAYMKLFPGPFNSNAAIISRGAQSVLGISQETKQAILNQRRATAPHVDVAVHLRTQFHHFEQGTTANIQRSTTLNNEVTTWLNSTEAKQILTSICEKVKSLVAARNTSINSLKRDIEGGSRHNFTDASIRLFVASDNEQVKARLISMLNTTQRELSSVSWELMHIEAGAIHHVKDLNKMKHRELFQLAFDWYAISLARTVLTWRRGQMQFAMSTFVHSAILAGPKDDHKGYRLVMASADQSQPSKQLDNATYWDAIYM